MNTAKSSVAWLVGVAPLGVLFWPMYAGLFSMYTEGSKHSASNGGTFVAVTMFLIGLIGHAGILIFRGRTMPWIGAVAAGFGFSAVLLIATTVLLLVPSFLGPSLGMKTSTFHSLFAPSVMLPLAFILGIVPSLALSDSRENRTRYHS